MPSKNTIKQYVENGFYHVYNRGVEKRNIFIDEQDYKVFLGYLKEYLSPVPESDLLIVPFTLQGETFKGKKRLPKNYFQKIELNVFNLLPNHFHLLLHQQDQNNINQFMQSLLTRYTMYFNRKYDRVGSLFQGVYKAILVDNEEYLLHLSRYIHLNSLEYYSDLIQGYSSYGRYIGTSSFDWVKPDTILSFFNQANPSIFNQSNSYEDFVVNYDQDSAIILGDFTLE